MLRMMNETRESLESTDQDWTPEALDFVLATSSASPNELSDVRSTIPWLRSLLRLASTTLSRISKALLL